MKDRLNLRLLCILFLVLDLLIATLLFASINESRRSISARPEMLAQQMGLDADLSDEEQQREFTRALGEAARHVSIYSEVTEKDGRIPIFLSNGEENTCAVSIELILFDSGETIAASGLVEPGWRLEELELDTVPDKGEHQCLVRCAFYTMDGNVFLGNTAKQLLLTVD